MNILSECAIDDDIILEYSVCATLCRLYINIIGGKYIFRVKTNKTQKKWAVFYVFFFFQGCN